MELDLCICVPQNNYEKTFQLNTSLTLDDLQKRVSKNTMLPTRVTFHKEMDEKSSPLDPSKPLRHHGYQTAYGAEPMRLYIYYPKDGQDNEISLSDSSKSPNNNVCNEDFKELVNGDQREVMVTILNPYDATDRVFVAKGILKLSDLLESYKERIQWKNDKGNLIFTKPSSRDTYNHGLSMSEITNKDEIILEVHIEGEREESNKRKQPEPWEDDEEIEFIEKKVKADNQQSKENSNLNTPIKTPKYRSTPQKPIIEKDGIFAPKISPLRLDTVNGMQSGNEKSSRLMGSIASGFSNQNNRVETSAIIQKETAGSAPDAEILVD